jgi:hypothetical protein
MLHGETVGRHIASGADELGRWTWLQLSAHKSKILIVVCYQVCRTPPPPPPRFTSKPKYSAFSQQQTMLLARGIVNPDPRAQFVKDLLDEFLTKMKSPNDKVLIVGDFNEVLLSNNQSGMDQIRQQHNLVDIMERTIGHSDFNTYKRGTSRIDYALLGTPDLATASNYQCGV